MAGPANPFGDMFRVLVFGPAAEYTPLLPDDPDLEAAFARPGATPDIERLPDDVGLVLLDLDFVGDGLNDLLPELGRLAGAPPVVAVSREPSTDSAVRVLTGGADDYLVWPRDRERVGPRIAMALDRWRGTRRGGTAETLPGFPDIVGRCPAMRATLEVVRKVIESGANTVLIRGETGTGKELVARAIHYQSDRADQPFVEVNCTAIPDSLLEAELFGYEKGAFTDAKTAKQGLLQLADGGTLFLDEMGDMSPDLQGKLLRAIEQQRFRRVGGTAEIAVRMRIIAATSRDLEEAIERGLFRSDLYYRLNVVSIELPPLRERDQDVILLAEHFAGRHADQYGKPRRALSDEAREFLLGYAWPGNVRELKNAVERAVLLGEGQRIERVDLEPAVRRRDEPAAGDRRQTSNGERLVIPLPPEGLSFDEYERRIIAAALRRNDWNRSKTARELEISRPRLLRKIEKYELQPAD